MKAGEKLGANTVVKENKISRLDKQVHGEMRGKISGLNYLFQC